MADDPIPDPATAPDLRGQGAQQAAGFVDTLDFIKFTEKLPLWISDAAAKLIGIVLKSAAKIGAFLAGTLAKAEDQAQPEFGELAAAAVADLFGVPNPGGASMTRGHRSGRDAVSNNIGDMLFKAFAGAADATSGGELAPTDAPAKKFLSTMTQLALEGWLEGWIVEACTLGQIETFGELDDIISHVLGLGRASSSVHGPLVKHLIVTPLEWKINKEHRPTLLSPALACKLFNAGVWTRDQVDEECARHGLSPTRINAMIADGRHELATGDITEMISSGLLDEQSAVPFLRLLGYDENTARIWGHIDRFRRERKYRDDIVPLAIRAFANRDIDGADLQNALDYALPNPSENVAARAHAEYARSFNIRRMSHGEIKDAVERGILAMPDYREWLKREGYPDGDALVLELLLESTIRGQHEAAQRKADAERQRAEDKAKRDAEREQRRRELEQKKARTFAPLADIERAVVLGILPMSAFTDELARQKFAAADIAFESELLQQRRDDYLAAVEKKQAAEGPPSPKTIALAKLERAVVLGYEPVETYAARLRAENYDAGDADTMIALVTAARGDRVRADQARVDAAARLAQQGLSLAQLEKTVRQGLLSLDDYAAQLVAKGFAASDAALLRASLDQDIQHAEDAAAVRAAVNAEAQIKGISLAQLERAVKLGVRDRADYQAKLIALSVPPDDQVTLLGVLDAELAELAAAKAKRDAPAPAPAPPGLSRADMEKAVRAGVLTIGAYRDYLVAAGYAADDVDVLASLLALEVQDLALARQRRAQLDAGDTTRQLARSDFERAVRRGIRTIGEYESFVSAAGYGDDDRALLVDLLRAELAAHDTAQRRHDKIADELAGAGVELGSLDAAAVAGELTLDDYVAQLSAAGVKSADIGLLVQLVIEPSSKGEA